MILVPFCFKNRHIIKPEQMQTSGNFVLNHNKSRNLLLLMISDREDREGKVLPKGGYEERTQRKSKRRKI